MKANKKANDLIFWARQHSFDGSGKLSARKQLECQIYHAKLIAESTTFEIEKEVKKMYKNQAWHYGGSIDCLYWKEVRKEIKKWDLQP